MKRLLEDILNHKANKQMCNSSLELNTQGFSCQDRIKPGTKEWFDNWFPLDNSRFSPGFRGRKK